MKGCWIARLGYSGCGARHDGGALDPAHFVPQSRVKNVLRARGVPRNEWAKIVWDTRCYTTICHQHHHELDQKRIRLSEEDYPEAFRLGWAKEHRFYWAGPRDGWKGEYVEPGDAAA